MYQLTISHIAVTAFFTDFWPDDCAKSHTRDSLNVYGWHMQVLSSLVPGVAYNRDGELRPHAHAQARCKR